MNNRYNFFAYLYAPVKTLFTQWKIFTHECTMEPGERSVNRSLLRVDVTINNGPLPIILTFVQNFSPHVFTVDMHVYKYVSRNVAI